MVPNQDIYFIQDNYFFSLYYQWYHGTTGVSDNIYFIQDNYFFSQYHQWYHGTTGISDNIYFIQDYYIFLQYHQWNHGTTSASDNFYLILDYYLFTASWVIWDYLWQWWSPNLPEMMPIVWLKLWLETFGSGMRNSSIGCMN